MDKKVISADGHLDLFFLPPDTFTARTTDRLKDKVPKVVNIDGIPSWVGDGAVMGTYRGWMGRGELTGHRGKRMMEAGWEPTHPSDPKLRVKDLDIDGVEAEVIYGIRFVEDSIRDAEVITATYRAYNDFIAEFCEYDPKRLIGVADIPAHSVEGAVDEIRRIGKQGLGLRGALFDWFNGPKPIWHPMWEPLWTAAEEADVALSFHIGAGHGTTTVGPSGVDEKLSGTTPRVSMLAHQAVVAMQADECLASVILCGALERHPKLKIVLAESHIGWIPYLLDRLDAKYKEGAYKDAIKTMPSELFRRQMWATFQDDKVGARLAEDYAPDSFCWASDYPHLDSVWPDSQAFIRKSMDRLSTTMQDKLTHRNVTTLYNL
jgi:predicted TIM-barrel fold metal-dependent hydrolase